MKKIILVALALVFTLSAVNGLAFKPHQLTLKEKRFDFEQLINQIHNQYGPKLFKKDQLGIDLNELSSKYWEKIKKTENNGDFYSLIVKFVAEFKDGHFGAYIPTKYVAYLPFQANLVQGKAVIENIDRKKLPEKDFPFKKGDELVSMGGIPVEDIIQELMTYKGTGNPKYLKASAVYALTYRPGTTFPVPEGRITVTIKPMGTETRKVVTLDWLHKGEPFDEHRISAISSIKLMMNDQDAPALPREETKFDPRNIEIFDLVSGYGPFADRGYHCNGETRIKIPEKATMLMETPFVAYYHPTEKGNIGYLRIPDYSPRMHNGTIEEWYANYTWALTILEENTKGLIIDQDHNCGGHVEYMEDLVALFMEGEVEPLAFRFRASKREILEWEYWLSSFDSPHNLTYEGYKTTLDLIKESFGNGLYLTPKTSLHGKRKIKGRGIYTKPVIILIDYNAGSGGDAFPAMMQGLERAKLLGTTTMGLGGHVIRMEPLFYSQIGTRMTQSLFYHPDGTAIENHGAVPDIPYEITMDDFLNEYQDYQTFYLGEILKMIN